MMQAARQLWRVGSCQWAGPMRGAARGMAAASPPPEFPPPPPPPKPPQAPVSPLAPQRLAWLVGGMGAAFLFDKFFLSRQEEEEEED